MIYEESILFSAKKNLIFSNKRRWFFWIFCEFFLMIGLDWKALVESRISNITKQRVLFFCKTFFFLVSDLKKYDFLCDIFDNFFNFGIFLGEGGNFEILFGNFVIFIYLYIFFKYFFIFIFFCFFVGFFVGFLNSFQSYYGCY